MQMLNNAAENIISHVVKHDGNVIIAIDGRCASGKTTLAELISEKTECNIIHMDDFFLRPEQRTKERHAETGGNIDYERFLEEVLIPLKETGECVYRPFDCHTMNFSEPVKVSRKSITVIEGSYSCHPLFYEYYLLRVFLTVSQVKQKERLIKRNPALYERFENEWIPLEEKYFREFEIAEKCNIVIET